MAKSRPLVAAPLKGPLFDFLELDVDMAPHTPASASLEHLTRCVVKPTWLASAPRDSGAPYATRAASLERAAKSDAL